ncbi:MAG: hypothetical protein Q8R35_02330 [bacterium]|nr:hypothetical protein [bacterium]
MRRLSMLALAAVLLVALAAPAYAGGRHHHGSSTGTNVALGLASFAVFNQIMGAFPNNRSHRTIVYEHVYAPPVVYYTQPSVVVAAPPPVVYQAAPVIIAPPPPPQTIYYPHGRHEFLGQQWVWIPNAPAPPPPSTSSGQAPPAAEHCQQTGKWVKTPYGFQPECR